MFYLTEIEDYVRVEPKLFGLPTLEAVIQQLKEIYSDYYDKEGRRHFEGMWLISENFVMESKNIETTETMDIARIPEAPSYIDIEKENYDMNTATQVSRLSVSILLVDDLRLKLKAGGQNCDVLREIVQKYFLPRI